MTLFPLWNVVCKDFQHPPLKVAATKPEKLQESCPFSQLIEVTKRHLKEHFGCRHGNASVCLQRSLPALRQMTPDSEAFIQQSLLPQVSTPAAAAAASTALTAVVLRPPLSTAATSTSSSTSTSAALTKTTVISLTQTPHSKPTLVL